MWSRMIWLYFSVSCPPGHLYLYTGTGQPPSLRAGGLLPPPHIDDVAACPVFLAPLVALLNVVHGVNPIVLEIALSEDTAPRPERADYQVSCLLWIRDVLQDVIAECCIVPCSWPVHKLDLEAMLLSPPFGELPHYLVDLYTLHRAALR